MPDVLFFIIMVFAVIACVVVIAENWLESYGYIASIIFCCLIWWFVSWMNAEYEWVVKHEYVSDIVVEETDDRIFHHFRKEKDGDLQTLEGIVSNPEYKQIKYIVKTSTYCYGVFDSRKREITEIINKEEKDANN